MSETTTPSRLAQTATNPQDAPADDAPWGLVFHDATVRYPNGVVGLDSITLQIEPGDMVAVVGLSGAGKSTFIRTVNGLVPLSEGSVEVGGQLISSMKPRALRRIRGSIGMIFQGFNLSARSSVMSNVLVGRVRHTAGWRTLIGWYPKSDRTIAFQALDQVGLLERAWTRASNLSGGQQQRVAIARALAQRPRLILADEPVASLDPPTAASIMGYLESINRKQGITMLINVHSVEIARRYANRIIGLRAGKLVFDGTAEEATDDVFAGIYGRAPGQDAPVGADQAGRP
ncbi:MAG: phosphonate ABC transporter ATP-binding protein [Bifidobacterium sp.]|jgi:phosphonate transport system ATP-binding protein|nr:phosphonate ABC transporter ATP-binding protein [Bifidobacterium sp.]